MRVEKAGDLEDALRAAFSHDGAALVDVRTDRHELSLPPKLTYGEVKGFTLCRREDAGVWLHGPAGISNHSPKFLRTGTEALTTAR